MISLEFLQEQLTAKPFVPFVLVLSSGDRYNIKTTDHADIPPIDEETGERAPWFIVYNERAIPPVSRARKYRCFRSRSRMREEDTGLCLCARCALCASP